MVAFILIVWLALMVGALTLAFGVVQSHQQRQQRYFHGRRRQLTRHKIHSRISRAAYINPGLAGSWHQLLIRVHFDASLAERLIQQLRQHYPNKPERWYIEKAIWDLERDRF